MKKVLLGLLALSAVTMAKPSDLTQSPAVGGTVFEATQEGAIGMSGALTSTIPKVKYVVYASKDNGATKEDVLQLTDFILSQDAAKGGFIGANPKVYVKRVVGGTYGELDTAENVEFKINHKDHPHYSTWRNQMAGFYPSTLSNKIEIEKILAANPVLAGFNVNSNDGHIRDKNNQLYLASNIIVIDFESKGVMTVTDINNPDLSQLSPEETRAIEDGFKNGIPMNVEMLIRVK